MSYRGIRPYAEWKRVLEEGARQCVVAAAQIESFEHGGGVLQFIYLRDVEDTPGVVVLKHETMPERTPFDVGVWVELSLEGGQPTIRPLH